MNPNYPTLPDSLSYLLLAFGIIAVVVYIKVTIDDIKAAQRERAMRGLKIAVKKNKTSQALAKHYKAVADGDPDDYDYWDKTADMFSGGGAE